MTNDPNDELPLENSKSQRKREMIELQKIGEALVALPDNDLAKIPLEEKLADAIQAARSITNHEGKRRQMQYIGRIMRDVEAAPIREALDKLQGKNQQSTAQFHQVERWRTRLLAEGDSVLREFLNKYPDADHQRLRQLVRNAQKDQAAGKNSGASTELFRCLREVVEGSK